MFREFSLHLNCSVQLELGRAGAQRDSLQLLARVRQQAVPLQLGTVVVVEESGRMDRCLCSVGVTAAVWRLEQLENICQDPTIYFLLLSDRDATAVGSEHGAVRGDPLHPRP